MSRTNNLLRVKNRHHSTRPYELPRCKLRGITCFKAVTPECSYRGSSQSSPGFPLKACGNDDKKFTIAWQAAGINP